MTSNRASTTRTTADADDCEGETNEFERPSKARRIRLACLRCQKRKIKCDGKIPKCSACQRSGAQCVDGKKTSSEGSISRSDAATLHSYIQNLEATVRNGLPSVDLSSLKPTDYSMTQDGTTVGLNEESSPIREDSVTDRVNTNPSGSNNRNEDLITNSQGRHGRMEQPSARNEIVHDIGLVPLSGSVNKYVGPSSGFALTNFLFDRARRVHHMKSFLEANVPTVSESPSTTTSRYLLTVEPSTLPPTILQARQLSRLYFEHVHMQYPFLHEPTYSDLLVKVYETPEYTPKWAIFQVTMVLSISASILAKRLPIPFSSESLFQLAMKDFDAIDMQSSMEGLQCLLLIHMFTLYSSFSGINPWYLNYQFLATVLDFGLQRDLPKINTVDTYDREMRRRLFWVIYTIDRTLATTLGRPIGLRDEGCDLRLPEKIEDNELLNPALDTVQQHGITVAIPQGSMMCAITLFRLAQINSEIKYILHSVNSKLANYTYPQIPDIAAWQNDVWERLKICNAEAPKYTDERRYLTITCSIRYQEVVMHLFRPTPHIRNPTKSSLQKCHHSAIETVALWKELYEADRMSYTWVAIHSICLSALTILYCIWSSPEISAATQIDTFTSTIRDASVLLSAAGEYWIEARRSRSRLDVLATATVRWLADKLRSPEKANIHRRRRQTRRRQETQEPSSEAAAGATGNFQGDRDPLHADVLPTMQEPASSSDPGFVDPTVDGLQANLFDSLQQSSMPDFDTYINNQDLASFLGAPDAFAGDSNFLIDGMFTEYQPSFEFYGNDMTMPWSF